MAKICFNKGSTGNANEALIDKPAVNERPVTIDGCPIANDNGDNAVAEIDCNLDPRTGGGVGGAMSSMTSSSMSHRETKLG